MNQILETKTVQNKLKKYISIFIFSIIAIIILLTIYFIKLVQNNEEKNFSKSISQNYKVYRLYAEDTNKLSLLKDNDIYGNIIIPKINVNYPFFYGISDDLLKISPCRFNGKMPNIKSNLCIAGHNYNDDRFFSKISSLTIGDEILIEDLNANTYIYNVYEIFEVTEDELFTYVDSYKNEYELTLVTCNNINNKRIIVKAKKIE
ncbi:MAG: sortase [Clostridia bacterium]|nr:sortase [Clostridia bacterium]